MSAFVVGINGMIHVPASRGKVALSNLGVTLGVFRLPTDPLFYATLTLKNIVGGSAYSVTSADTGAVLASGTAPGSGLTDVAITGVSCYANPQAVNVTVRKGTAAPKYQPGVWQTEINKSGGTAYIAQVPDSIA